MYKNVYSIFMENNSEKIKQAEKITIKKVNKYWAQLGSAKLLKNISQVLIVKFRGGSANLTIIYIFRSACSCILAKTDKKMTIFSVTFVLLTRARDGE